MATKRFHEDKAARSALRRAIVRAHEHDGERVLLERSPDGARVLEPLDAWVDRITSERKAEPCGASAPISSTYLRPDPDRRALIDQWLADQQRPHAA